MSDMSIFDEPDEQSAGVPLLGMAKLQAEEEERQKRWATDREAAREEAESGVLPQVDITSHIDASIVARALGSERARPEGSNPSADAALEPSIEDAEVGANDADAVDVASDNGDVDGNDNNNNNGVPNTDRSANAPGSLTPAREIDDPFGDLVSSSSSDDDDLADFDDFDEPEGFDGEAVEIEDDDVDEVDQSVIAELEAEEERAADERDEQELQEIQRQEQEARERSSLNESSLDGATEAARSYYVDITRNPPPMTDEATRIDEDRPMVRAAHAPGDDVAPGTSKPEPMSLGDGPSANVKIPTALMNTIRAVAVQALASSTFELSPTQRKQARGHVGSKVFDEMTEKAQRDAWLDYINKKFANNRLTVAFLAAQANLDIEGLDETTAMIVDRLRCVDPVLRELHTNTARLDAVLASERKTRELDAEMVQTLRGLEIAASFMVAWTTLEGSRGVAETPPGKLKLLNGTTRVMRDRIQAMTKQEINKIKRETGQPM